MDANYERFFIVVHGTVEKYLAMARNNGRAKLTYSKVQNELIGTIARLMSDFDCQVFYCNNVSEAASFIVRLHGKLHKPASKHGAQSIRRVASNDLRLDMIMTVPGIGQETAEKLLEKCGSIEEMCFPESIKKVKGLGDVRRKMLVNILTSEEPVRQERKVRR
jgi:ERCC4-type nuclease